ncbi:unnamed protein product [Heligmosomoides polygyrus]|uniref:Thioredoxin domain-containing protein 17 n=1 Tax=Heligmosomoides polygyrus TaxID=6339 RepID=A0A183G9Y6_HELPZ|nr:unnamed protein product [Heligmosomoides polygyrus]
MKEVTADGFEEVQKAITTASGRVFILFTGSKVDGKSWCPDCVKGDTSLCLFDTAAKSKQTYCALNCSLTAEPIVESVVHSAEGKALDATFITCYVGAREYWKDPACPFRTHPAFKLTCVPTLVENGKKVRESIMLQLLDSSEIMLSNL